MLFYGTRGFRGAVLVQIADRKDLHVGIFGFAHRNKNCLEQAHAAFSQTDNADFD